MRMLIRCSNLTANATRSITDGEKAYEVANEVSGSTSTNSSWNTINLLRNFKYGCPEISFDCCRPCDPDASHTKQTYVWS